MNDSINLNVGDNLRVHIKNKREVITQTCSITCIENDKIWLTMPRVDASYVDLREGMRIGLVMPQGGLALGASTTVITARIARLRREFAVYIPNEWQLLAKRASTRLNIDQPATIRRIFDISKGIDKRIPVQVLETSALGAKIRARAPVRQGTMLILEYALPYNKSMMTIACKITRLIATDGTTAVSNALGGSFVFGVRYVKIRQDDLALIEQFVAENSGAGQAYIYFEANELDLPKSA